jgi:hypothetical protein
MRQRSLNTVMAQQQFSRAHRELTEMPANNATGSANSTWPAAIRAGVPSW